jgi:phage recombination protein Bet
MNEVKNELQVVFEVDGSEVKLTQKIVQDYLVSGGQSISLPEFKMFTELCKVRKLNPFLKEAYIIKYGSEPAQLVVGKDAILKRAIKHAKFNGRQQGVIVLTDKGELLERNGTFKLDTEKLVGAWAKVFRKDWEFPTYVTVSFDEVAQKKKDGTLNSNWYSKGATMVEKVALVRALRETFVEELGGMVDEDEVWSNKDLANRKTEKEIVHQSDPLEAVITEKTVSLDEI